MEVPCTQSKPVSPKELVTKLLSKSQHKGPTGGTQFQKKGRLLRDRGVLYTDGAGCRHLCTAGGAPNTAKLLRGEWGRCREDCRTRSLHESTQVKTGYRSPGTSHMASETCKLHDRVPRDQQGEGRAGKRQSHLPGF